MNTLASDNDGQQQQLPPTTTPDIEREVADAWSVDPDDFYSCELGQCSGMETARQSLKLCPWCPGQHVMCEACLVVHLTNHHR